VNDEPLVTAVEQSDDSPAEAARRHGWQHLSADLCPGPLRSGLRVVRVNRCAAVGHLRPPVAAMVRSHSAGSLRDATRPPADGEVACWAARRGDGQRSVPLEPRARGPITLRKGGCGSTGLLAAVSCPGAPQAPAARERLVEALRCVSGPRVETGAGIGRG